MKKLGYERLKLFIQSVPENAVEVHEMVIPSWYCKPCILESLGDYFNRVSNGLVVFVGCSKYGCRQFIPKFHYTFPISDVFTRQLDDLDIEIIPVFNDSALPFNKK